MEKKAPYPPFTEETAKQKIQAAEDAWNSKNPEKIALAYTVDSEWRNRSEFVNGRPAIIAFLKGKWQKELDYKLKKSYWAHTDNRIAVRFEYEWRDDLGQWYRAYGNENWEFDENGLMERRYASINDLPIAESERKLQIWDLNKFGTTDRYREVLDVTWDPIVSTDIIKNPYASTIDLNMTRVVDGNLLKVMTWYDNEWGFTNQMIRQILEL